MLAGPGTGKTTTLVEAVVERIEGAGLSPDAVLVLTFSRKAAESCAPGSPPGSGRTIVDADGQTFHAFCYALLRRTRRPTLYADPLRLLTGPEQDVASASCSADDAERAAWPERSARRWPPGGSRARCARCSPGPASWASTPDDARRARRGEPAGRSGSRRRRSSTEYLDVLDAEGVLDYAELIRRAVLLADRRDRAELRAAVRGVRRRVPGHRPGPGRAAAGARRRRARPGRSSVTPTSPSTPSAAPRSAASSTSRRVPATPTARPRRVVALGTTRRFGPGLLAASRRVAARLAVPGLVGAEAFARLPRTGGRAGPCGAGRVEVLTFTPSGAEAEHIADLLRRAHLEDGVPWDEMAVLVRSGRPSIPGLSRALTAAGVPVEVAGDEIPLAREPAVRPLLDARCGPWSVDDATRPRRHVDPGGPRRC